MGGGGMTEVQIVHDIPKLPDRREWLITVDGSYFERYFNENEALHAQAVIRGDVSPDLEPGDCPCAGHASWRLTDGPSPMADLFQDAADTEYLRKYDIRMTPHVEAIWRHAQASMR
jgi:hypothetical protein